MAIYKVLFHPLEEYFFGMEGSFREGVKNAEYFITSSLFPSQTTVFGIIRYLNLSHVKNRRNYSKVEIKENIKAIGEKGFCFETAVGINSEKQEFGMIKAMSSIFLHEFDIENKGSHIYIPLPKDAKKLDEGSEKSYISVFSGEEERVNSLDGEKLIPKDYDAKFGFESGFISIDGGVDDSGKMLQEKLKILNNPFEYVLKTGLRINKKIKSNQEIIEAEDNEQNPMSSLFKKEYVRLKQNPGKKEYSFGVYVEIDYQDEKKVIEKLNCIIGMGLGGALFKVKTTKISGEEGNRLQNDLVLRVDKMFEDHPKKDQLMYCISPCYLDAPQEIMKKTQFASVETIVNRSLYSRKINEKWEKGNTLYRMLDSGSVLITENMKDILNELENKALQQIGYNHYYFGGKK